nr:MAG TPA: hypothetical protein [Caudoviricetes sp.]
MFFNVVFGILKSHLFSEFVLESPDFISDFCLSLWTLCKNKSL